MASSVDSTDIRNQYMPRVGVGIGPNGSGEGLLKTVAVEVYSFITKCQKFF